MELKLEFSNAIFFQIYKYNSKSIFFSFRFKFKVIMKFWPIFHKSVLYFAAQNSSPEIVDLLLERQDININDTSIKNYCFE